MRWEEVDGPAKREETTNTCYWEAGTENPGVVAWYSAWRLEAEVTTSLQVMKDVISSPAVPDIARAQHAVEKRLAAQVGEDAVENLQLQLPSDWGAIDDYWATFEWSEGGLIHVRLSLWIVGSPRIDVVKIAAQGVSGIDDMNENEIENVDDEMHGKSTKPKDTIWHDEGDVILDDEPCLVFYKILRSLCILT